MINKWIALTDLEPSSLNARQNVFGMVIYWDAEHEQEVVGHEWVHEHRQHLTHWRYLSNTLLGEPTEDNTFRKVNGKLLWA